MPDINLYYLEKATLSNLKRIFNSSDFPFVRLSKFLDIESVDYEPKLEREEKIGYYNPLLPTGHEKRLVLDLEKASSVYALKLTGVAYSTTTFDADSRIFQTIGTGATAVGRVISYNQNMIFIEEHLYFINLEDNAYINIFI